MTESELPEAVHQLIRQRTPTMDHVVSLVSMRAAPDTEFHAADLAAVARIEVSLVSKLLPDLAAAGLIAALPGGAYRYSPEPGLIEAVDQLAEMYNSRPVTLIRAVYDRPASAAKSFANAFRLRAPDR